MKEQIISFRRATPEEEFMMCDHYRKEHGFPVLLDGEKGYCNRCEIENVCWANMDITVSTKPRNGGE